MSLLERAQHYKQNRKDGSVNKTKNKQIIGLLRKAEHFNRVTKSQGLLYRASKLHRKVVNKLGLYARAEQIRKSEKIQKKNTQNIEAPPIQNTQELEQSKVTQNVPEEITSPSIKENPQKPSFFQGEEFEEDRNPKIDSLPNLPLSEEEYSVHKKIHENLAEPFAEQNDKEQNSEKDISNQKQIQYKLEQYNTLLELIKEIQMISNINDFWGTACNAIIGELGVENIIIFAPKKYNVTNLNEHFFYNVYDIGFSKKPINKRLDVHKGLLPFMRDQQDDHSFSDSKDQFNEDRKIIPHSKVFSVQNLPQKKISLSDKSLLKNLQSKFVLYVGHKEKVEAVLLIGPSILDTDYSSLEEEFLQTLGEFIFLKLNQLYEKEQPSQETEKYKNISLIVHSASKLDTIEKLFELLGYCLEKIFSSFFYSISLFSKEKRLFSIFHTEGLSQESQELYHIDLHSNIVGFISNFSKLYHIDDFRSNEEIVQNYTEEDLNKMSSYWIIPLIQGNCLLGFITLYDLEGVEWTSDLQELALYMGEVIVPYLVIFITQKSLEDTGLYFQPLSILKIKLEKEFARLEEDDALSVVDLRTQNTKLIQKNIDPSHTNTILSKVTESIINELSPGDYISRLSSEHFSILLPKKNLNATKNWIKKVIRQFPKDIKPISRVAFKKKGNRGASYSYTIISLNSKSTNIEKVYQAFL